MLFVEERSDDSGNVMMEARASHMIPVLSQANGEIKKETEDSPGENDEMMRYKERESACV